MWKIIATLLVIGTVGVVVLKKVDEKRPPILGEEEAWSVVTRDLFGKEASRDWTALRWHRDRKGVRVTYRGWEYRIERAFAKLDEEDVRVGAPFEMESVAGQWMLVARHSAMFDYLWEKVTGD